MASLFWFCTAAHRQGVTEAQIHHALHQENVLSDRADWPIPPLEVWRPRRRVKLWWFWYVCHPSTYCTINNHPLIHHDILFIPYYLSPVLLISHLPNWSQWFIALNGIMFSIPPCTQSGMEIVMTETSVPCGRSPQSGPAPWTSSRRATQTQTQRSVFKAKPKTKA